MTYERDNGGPDALWRDVRYAVGSVLTTATNYPPSVQARLLGQDMGPLIAKTVDAVMTALETKHATRCSVRLLPICEGLEHDRV